MDIGTYKPLIAKVLSKLSGRGLLPDQVAAAICERISSFEEDMALMGGKAAIIQGPTQEAGMMKDLQDGPYPALEKRIDISERVGAEQETFVERFTKDQLLEFARDQMPSLLQVRPPDFDAPIEIHKFVEAAPGDLGFVSIVYQIEKGQTIEGQRMGPFVRIATSDKFLDADELTDSIRSQANALYTKNKKVLVPLKPPPMMGQALVGNIPGDRERQIAEMGGAPGSTMPEAGGLSQQWNSQKRSGSV